MEPSFGIVRGLKLENSILGITYPISWKSYCTSANQLQDAMEKTSQDVGEWQSKIHVYDGDGVIKTLPRGIGDLTNARFKDARGIALGMQNRGVDSRVSLLYDRSNPAQLQYGLVNPTDEAMDVFDEIVLTRGPFKRVLHNYSAGVCVVKLDLRNSNIPSAHNL